MLHARAVVETEKPRRVCAIWRLDVWVYWEWHRPWVLHTAKWKRGRGGVARRTEKRMTDLQSRRGRKIISPCAACCRYFAPGSLITQQKCLNGIKQFRTYRERWLWPVAKRWKNRTKCWSQSIWMSLCRVGGQRGGWPSHPLTDPDTDDSYSAPSVHPMSN